MELDCDIDGFVYYNELLFKTMKNRYGEERIKNIQLAEAELGTMKKIYKISSRQRKDERKKEKVQIMTVNPFLTQMYFNMAREAWKNLWKKNLKKRIADQNEKFKAMMEEESWEQEEAWEPTCEYVYYEPLTQEEQKQCTIPGEFFNELPVEPLNPKKEEESEDN